MTPLRPLTSADLDQVLSVYEDAVRSQAGHLYSARQIEAWAGHARGGPELRAALQRGWGLVSCSERDAAVVEAFALLDPIDRLSLLYCRGRSCRQGRATALLQAAEAEARRRGCRRLRTEASQLSRPLLLRHHWQVEAEETVLYAGVPFVRWRMIKSLVGAGDG
jgi:putative acetyltransferase